MLLWIEREPVHFRSSLACPGVRQQGECSVMDGVNEGRAVLRLAV